MRTLHSILLILVISSCTILVFNDNQVFAQTIHFNKDSQKQFGSETSNIVCGDHLCEKNSVHMKMHSNVENVFSGYIAEHLPTIQTIDIHKVGNSPELYLTEFKIKGGDLDLSSIKIMIYSDMEQSEIDIDGLFSNQHSLFGTRIHADSPSSINTSIIGNKFAQ